MNNTFWDMITLHPSLELAVTGIVFTSLEMQSVSCKRGHIWSEGIITVGGFHCLRKYATMWCLRAVHNYCILTVTHSHITVVFLEKTFVTSLTLMVQFRSLLLWKIFFQQRSLVSNLKGSSTNFTESQLYNVFCDWCHQVYLRLGLRLEIITERLHYKVWDLKEGLIKDTMMSRMKL